MRGTLLFSLLLLLISLITAQPADDNDLLPRLEMLDSNMQRLNLTDIHFLNPNDIVKVETVVNVFRPIAGKDLYQIMQEKLNETQEYMVNASPAERKKWKSAVIVPPLPKKKNGIRAGRAAASP
ncbi:unnamed protein product [Caenorhabditis sp. 36 PRJEB53466]|nr:unnamed protein product [Caenorhabditis sp. 36 PRJEB53466]